MTKKTKLEEFKEAEKELKDVFSSLAEKGKLIGEALVAKTKEVSEAEGKERCLTEEELAQVLEDNKENAISVDEICGFLGKSFNAALKHAEVISEKIGETLEDEGRFPTKKEIDSLFKPK